jgi:lysophospholipid acyltransferase (LPLAT)-like uncharacterized protein
VLRTWDGFVIPKPGADILFAYGAPLFVGPDESIDAASQRLEQQMLALEQFAAERAADRTVGRPL